MRHLILTLMATCLLASGPAAAETVYKITDANGKVRYSDEKPQNPGNATVTTITIAPQQNVLNTDAGMQQWLDKKDNSEQQAADRKTQAMAEWQAEYDAAKTALENAEAALAAGKEPQEGDFVGIANRFGGSAGARPSEEFLERVKGLEQAVDAAREQLEEVAARKPDISTQ